MADTDPRADRIKVSLRVRGNGAMPGSGHLGAGFLMKPDLVVVPHMSPQLLESGGPYTALVVEFNDPDFRTVGSVQRISCTCAEVVECWDGVHALFELAIASHVFLPVEDVDAKIKLLTDPETGHRLPLWPTFETDIIEVPSFPDFKGAKRVVFTGAGDEGGICRLTRKC